MEDVLVIERDALDPEYAANFTEPWLVQFENGAIREFETEELACAFQREHRLQHNLDPITGDPQ